MGPIDSFNRLGIFIETKTRFITKSFNKSVGSLIHSARRGDTDNVVAIMSVEVNLRTMELLFL